MSSNINNGYFIHNSRLINLTYRLLNTLYGMGIINPRIAGNMRQRVANEPLDVLKELAKIIKEIRTYSQPTILKEERGN